MKLMVCANLGVGTLPAFDLPAADVMRWQEDKVDYLGRILADAKGHGAQACLIAGGLFAKGFVAQSLYEAAMRAVSSSGLRVLYVPLFDEAADLEARCRHVDGFEVVVEKDILDKSGIALRDIDELTDFADVADACEVPTFVRGASGLALACRGVVYRLGPLTCDAFGSDLQCGYALVDVDAAERTCSGFEWVDGSAHRLVTVKVALDEPKSADEVAIAVGNAVKDMDRGSCLRIELRGGIPLGTYVDTDDLARRLAARFRYVEIADYCDLGLDVEGLASDVSLLAEFVRRVSDDDSLSPTEKTRVLRCGWNALNGKELAE